MTERLLDIEDLSVRIRTRRHTVQALSDVRLRVDHGEVVGLVGESGGGKTMLARATIGMLPRGARASGTVRLEGRDVLQLTGRQLAAHRGQGAAMCFQNPRRALTPVRTIGHQIADRLEVHQGLRGGDADDEALRLLRAVGLRDARQRLGAYPHELSGGMAQRVMIATALACRPRLLLADEPTTGLDVTLTQEILELFRAVADEQDRGVLLVSHDIASVAGVCDRVVVLYAGTVIEAGPTGDVLRRPAHHYTRALLRAVPELDGRRVEATAGSMPLLDSPPTRCPYADRCPAVDDGCRASPPVLARGPAGRQVACFHPLEAGALDDERARASARLLVRSPTPNGSAVRVDGVSVRYRGRWGAPAHDAVRGVSFRVDRGETLGIVGESGCGKSTLARVVLGLQPATTGAVRINDTDIATASAHERDRLRTSVQMVFQDPVGSLSPRRSVKQAITEPMIAAGVPGPEHERRIVGLLRRVGLDPSFLGRRPHELSGGQAQRVAIARALSVDPSVVVFDEPTSALDVTVQAQILELLEELAASADRAYLLISHDLAVVRSMCHRVIVLYLGRIVEEGSTAEVFTNPRHPYTRALLAGAPRVHRDDTSVGTARLAREPIDGGALAGCPLRSRCPLASDVCAEEPPLAAMTAEHRAACWRAGELPSDSLALTTTGKPAR